LLMLFPPCVQEVDALAVKQPTPRDLQKRQLQLLKQGAEFLFRAQQLVSGLDAATKQSFQALRTVLEQVQEGTYRPGAHTAAVAAVEAAAMPAAAPAAAAVAVS
jgi:hypothetical protein